MHACLLMFVWTGLNHLLHCTRALTKGPAAFYYTLISRKFRVGPLDRGYGYYTGRYVHVGT